MNSKDIDELFYNTTLSRDLLFLWWEKLIDKTDVKFALKTRAYLSSYQMAHSYTLLRLAADSFRKAGWEWGAAYLEEHAEEESEHFLWGVSDYSYLKHLETKQVEDKFHLLDFQQFMIQLYNSLEDDASFFLGYMFSLEATPAKEGHWESFLIKHNLPLEVARSPVRHTIADKEHAEEIRNFLNEGITSSFISMDRLIDGAIETNKKVIKFFEGAIDAFY